MSKYDLSLNDSKELRKTILENPNLPLLVFASEEANGGNYGYEQVDVARCGIEELTLYEDMWLNKEGYMERLGDDLAYDGKYTDLDDEAYWKMIGNKVKEAEFVKAIVVWLG